MFEIREKPEMVERAMLVSIYFDPSEAGEKQAMLDELEDLVSNLGIGIAGKHLIKSRDMHAKFLCGTGKAQEVKQLALDCRADCVVFDNMLSPSQQREWERLVDECVIDREEVILDIFARRARTREATLQVELARMQYSLPRMARMWNHLDRQGGGSGGGKGGGGAARGEGEKQIEVDRRLARARIEAIQRELVLVTRQRATQRKERERQAVATAAIVGYTNAGKSSLLSLVSGSEVMARDMLFATLDTTTRKIELPHGQPLLLTDTVGFIRNLPHRLVEAFKSTLEEAVLADFLIQKETITGKEFMKIFRKIKGIPEPKEEKEKDKDTKDGKEKSTETDNPSDRGPSGEEQKKESVIKEEDSSEKAENPVSVRQRIIVRED